MNDTRVDFFIFKQLSDDNANTKVFLNPCNGKLFDIIYYRKIKN